MRKIKYQLRTKKVIKLKTRLTKNTANRTELWTLCDPNLVQINKKTTFQVILGQQISTNKEYMVYKHQLIPYNLN